ncbi:MAG: hypothetical protein ACRCZP_00460 [Phycicoccus sp.]
MPLALSYDRDVDRVVLSATALPAGATVAKFERSVDNASWTTVRRAAAVLVSGGAAGAVDHEFSPSTLTYYRVTAVGTSSTEQTTVPIVPELSRCWIKFPTDPATNLPFDGLAGRVLTGWGEIARGGRGQVLPIIGSAYPAVLHELAETRAFTLSLRTADDTSRRVTDDALRRGLPILLQLHPAHAHALDSMYALVTDIRYDRPAARSRAYRWTLGLVEIGPLSPTQQGFRTYADLKAAVPTYADLR